MSIKLRLTIIREFDAPAEWYPDDGQDIVKSEQENLAACGALDYLEAVEDGSTSPGDVTKIEKIDG